MPARLRTYLREEAAGGIVLMAVAAVALGWANSPWRDAYGALVGSGLRHWVNDYLMALFFLVVGLEIKRELVAGELATWRRAACPVVAAAGGMAVPAAIYAAVNAGRPGAPGWGVPMATDIAFALGVLALLGPRGAGRPKDLPAHPGRGRRPRLGRGGGPVLQPRERQPGPVWGGRRPARPGPGGGLAGRAAGPPPPPAERVPGRAAVRAGQRRSLDRAGGAGRGRSEAVLGGVLAGRVLGKLAGITAATWLAVRLGLAARQEGTSWAQLAGVATVAGIGFTVPLFVADLAFPDGRFAAPVKLGLLLASVVSGLVGALVLVRTARR